jgi:hypothetical protein
VGRSGDEEVMGAGERGLARTRQCTSTLGVCDKASASRCLCIRRNWRAELKTSRSVCRMS